MTETIAIDETARLISSDKVDGTAVYGPDGDRLGTVRNFMVDKVSGKADYAVLQFGGVFGLGSAYYPIPWKKLGYDVDLGGYVVDITKEQLEAAPRYNDELPTYDAEYGRRIDSYYGVPGAPFI